MQTNRQRPQRTRSYTEQLEAYEYLVGLFIAYDIALGDFNRAVFRNAGKVKAAHNTYIPLQITTHRTTLRTAVYDRFHRRIQ